jgi:hypothetical protein
VYFRALHALSITLYHGQPQKEEIIQFTAVKNIAAATTRVDFTFSAFNISMRVTINTWMIGSSTRGMAQYIVVFQWFGNLH